MVGSSSWSRLQSAVALVAGLSSIGGAAYSALGTLRSQPGGEIVAIVRDAATAEPVHAAVIEILNPDSALVTTIVQGDDGIARRTVPPGAYRIRVTHPDFVEAVRDVQVLPHATAEVRVALAHPAHPSSVQRTAAPHRNETVVGGAAHAVDRSIGAGRRLLGRLGF